MNDTQNITVIQTHLDHHARTDLVDQLSDILKKLRAGHMIPENVIHAIIREIEAALGTNVSAGHIEDFRRHLYGLTGRNITTHTHIAIAA